MSNGHDHNITRKLVAWKCYTRTKNTLTYKLNTEKQRTLTEQYLWVDKQILIGKSGTIKLLIILNSKDYQYGKC